MIQPGQAVLLLDAGNTRIKWRLVHGRAPAATPDPLPPTVARGAVDALSPDTWTDGFAGLAAWLARQRGSHQAEEPLAVAFVCVASSTVESSLREHLRAVLARGHAGPVSAAVARSTAQFGPLTNGYEVPEQLGPDRLVGLLGGFCRFGAPLVLATCGTALTVDVLSANARFEGGVIAPGLAASRQALLGAAARLSTAPGHARPLGTGTADAIESGLVHAACGAIERVLAHARMRHGETTALVLSGGDAQRIAPHLRLPGTVVDNCVLDGLWQALMVGALTPVDL